MHSLFASQTIATIAAAQALVNRQTASAAIKFNVPLFVIVPVAFLAAIFLLRAVLRYLRKRGSVTELEDRGHLAGGRNNKTDKSFKDVMRKVRTVEYTPLSEEQIMAARRRRSRERDSAVLDVDDVELPENHPFAVNKKLTDAEEKLIQARLSVQRGLPVQDLQGTRGLPEERAGDKDGQAMQRHQTRQRGPSMQ